jgi:hypothetical protein
LAKKHQIESKIVLPVPNLRKWGGLFVFIVAMVPLPHSIVGLACGLIILILGSMFYGLYSDICVL